MIPVKKHHPDRRRRAVLGAGVGLAAGAGFALPARAQEAFPSRPIRIVVGFVAGGVSDVLARLVAPELQKALGVSVLVENRPGASGMIAAGQVAKLPADGYTLYMAPNTHLINHAINPNTPYDSVKDFTGITLLTTTPNMLVVKDDSPYRTVADFVAAARAKPGELSYATSGIGTTVHFAGELLAYQAGIKLNHVPFKGSADAHTQIIGGQVPMMFDAIPATLPHIKSGRLRGLGIATLKRSPFLPDLPTIAEGGYAGFEAVGWIGIAAPAKTPVAILNTLNAEMVRILGEADVKEKLNTLAFTPVGDTREQFAAYIKSEIAKWGKAVKDSGAKAE